MVRGIFLILIVGGFIYLSSLLTLNTESNPGNYAEQGVEEAISLEDRVYALFDYLSSLFPVDEDPEQMNDPTLVEGSLETYQVESLKPKLGSQEPDLNRLRTKGSFVDKMLRGAEEAKEKADEHHKRLEKLAGDIN